MDQTNPAAKVVTTQPPTAQSPAQPIPIPVAPAPTGLASPTGTGGGFDLAQHAQRLASYGQQLGQISALKTQHDQLAAKITAATTTAETDLAALLTQLGYDPAVGVETLKAASQ